MESWASRFAWDTVRVSSKGIGSAAVLTQRAEEDRCVADPPRPPAPHLAKPIRKGQKNGFTIVELLIAMALIITLFAIAVPNLMAALDLAKVARAVGDIHTIEDEIALYQVVNGALPDDLSQVATEISSTCGERPINI